MKRIALMLSGLSRTYRETAESLLQNVVLVNQADGYAVDVFIHTWSEKDCSDVVWHNPDGKKRADAMKGADYQDLVERYQPKALAVELPLDIPKEPVLNERLKPFMRSYSSIASCFYSRWRVNQLREDYSDRTGVHYDYVILTRLDVLYKHPFRLKDFFGTFEQYGCTVPNDHVFTSATPFKRGMIDNDFMRCCTDIVLFARPRIMTRICSFYEELAAGRLSPEFVTKELYGMEVLWSRYWEKENIPTTFLRFQEEWDYSILRSAANTHYTPPSAKQIRHWKLKRNFRSFCDVFRPAFNWLVEPFAVAVYAARAGLKAAKTLIREL